MVVNGSHHKSINANHRKPTTTTLIKCHHDIRNNELQNDIQDLSSISSRMTTT
jgi:hypothetical protein